MITDNPQDADVIFVRRSAHPRVMKRFDEWFAFYQIDINRCVFFGEEEGDLLGSRPLSESALADVLKKY